jgi:cell division protein ZipA
VYLWSKGFFSRRLIPQLPRRKRVEPSIGEAPSTADVPPGGDVLSDLVVEPVTPPPKAPPAPPDRIVALRLMPRGDELSAERTIAALQGANLRHGRYSIFHRPLPDPEVDEAAFSVASLTEPGTFDLDNMGAGTIAGLSFFLVLPGSGDPVARFDAMVETARALGVELDCELLDERGSSWSVQRERYIREEIIEYRHQLERR